MRAPGTRGRRIGRWLLAGLLVLVVAVAAGPRVNPHLRPSPLPTVPQSPAALDAWIAQRERGVAGLRPDNQARIVWADPAHPARTACSIVYLHGFSASQGEGAPLHRQLAETFGCNLYLPRLPGHGLDADDALRGIDAQQWLDSAAEALAVGRVLGQRTVVIGTSMGGALALQMAAEHGDRIAATVLWSPLVRERDEQLRPLLWPWGATLLSWLKNGGSDIFRGSKVDSAYWARATHLDGYRAVAALSRGGMNPDTFIHVRTPLFLGYYYRDAQHQDATVSVAAMLDMYARLGTSSALRWRRNFPEAGDHVIASPLRSHASAQVFASTCQFLRRVARLAPVDAASPHPCAPPARPEADVSLSLSR